MDRHRLSIGNIRSIMWTVLSSAGIGAIAMYYLDPARGRYRRSLVRDQFVHGVHKAQSGLDATARDMHNRVVGTLASLRARFQRDLPSDPVLAERVHAKIGRIVTHPGSIDVRASDGIVTLSGPILAEEVPRLVDGVLDVPGVTGVADCLEVYSSPEHVPGLQGRTTPKSGRRSAFFQTNWSPTARALGFVTGATMALSAFRRRNAVTLLAGGAGLLLAARAVTNLELRRLLGVGIPRHAVDVQKAIRISAPVEKVFETWANFENFPRFMTHIRRVRALEDRQQAKRWRWTVRTPTGMEFEFDTVITAYEQNHTIGWRTDAGGPVQHSGRVYFHVNQDGSTTVDIKMIYSPIAGALGHAVAWLLGVDPKHQMDDDLLRFKTFIETGTPPHDAAARGQQAAPAGARPHQGGSTVVH